MTTGLHFATHYVLQQDHDTQQIVTHTVFSCNQGEEYDQLWTLRTVFDTLNKAYVKFYNPSEHLAVGNIIVNFKGRFVFKQYIPKKENMPTSKFTNSVMNQCIHMTRVYLGKDAHSVTDDVSATHTTVRHLTCRVEGLGHKIFMYNFFSSPRLFDDLDRRKINSCGTVWPNRKDMTHDFGPKQLKLKRGDVKVKTKGG